MNEELNKELSRLQLLNSRYKNKLRMCPLEIKNEEARAFVVFNYIKQLQQENTQLKENWDKLEELIKEVDFLHFNKAIFLDKMNELKGSENE